VPRHCLSWNAARNRGLGTVHPGQHELSAGKGDKRQAVCNDSLHDGQEFGKLLMSSGTRRYLDRTGSFLPKYLCFRPFDGRTNLPCMVHHLRPACRVRHIDSSCVVVRRSMRRIAWLRCFHLADGTQALVRVSFYMGHKYRIGRSIALAVRCTCTLDRTVLTLTSTILSLVFPFLAVFSPGLAFEERGPLLRFSCVAVDTYYSIG
jgi:hypothetical protein